MVLLPEEVTLPPDVTRCGEFGAETRTFLDALPLSVTSTASELDARPFSLFSASNIDDEAVLAEVKLCELALRFKALMLLPGVPPLVERKLSDIDLS